MNDERETPQWLFDKLDSIFHFDLDAAATSENAKCERYLTKEDDACRIGVHWGMGDSIFVNPPYSRGGLHRWVEKARYESVFSLIVMLLPADTSTRAFASVSKGATALFFFGKRIDFGVGNGAKFPSLLAIFGEVSAEQLEKLSQELDGWLVIEKNNLHLSR